VVATSFLNGWKFFESQTFIHMLRKTLINYIKANQTWGCINPFNPNGINCCINMC
jgi:hypothetical protein